MIEKVTYFDVEYANPTNKSICQIGIMCLNYSNEEPYFPELNIYINPEDNFEYNCIKTHGITADKVKEEDNFPTVWKKIEKYFSNAVIIGHNVAGSDLDSLTKNLKRYNIDVPEFHYICTLQLARQYIPSFAVKDYKLSTLCEYLDVALDSEHDAFDDACSCADLFKAITTKYNIDINKDIEIKSYNPHTEHEFLRYVSTPIIGKEINDLYGLICGFSIDNKLSSEEIDFLKNWGVHFPDFHDQKDIAEIISVLNEIIADGVITLDEINKLKNIISEYLKTLSTTPSTLASRSLEGILKGITIDNQITETECKKLRQWLYDNIPLLDQVPFINKTMEVLNKVLEDSIITKDEKKYITDMIDQILTPVDYLTEKINSVEGKNVCLSGRFSYGSKDEVGKYIISKGGYINERLKKSTDILIIGSQGCPEYTNGSYGGKVKKAMQFNEKGCSIKIIKESDCIFDEKK